ncbi:MAG: arsenate reductase ArsC [Thermoplasmataceae archaeon]|jgi:protein-tyrosine-phosphatase|nr:MAG: Low molecular weight phosphotyrosine protein phosphatase [Thermoplasmatales archaeon E-plasma]MCL4347957.1 arsenate reductase ArsC [Candidatus Thermoplasmatota archaeon]
MKFLFVCIENAGRSKMAEAFARSIGLNASSAGTVPASEVNPTVVKVMEEVGIEISQSKPKYLDAQMIDEADRIILMGCSVESVCPAVLLGKMKKKSEDWNLEDPKGKPIEEVRKIRDEIQARVRALRNHNK